MRNQSSRQKNTEKRKCESVSGAICKCVQHLSPANLREYQPLLKPDVVFCTESVDFLNIFLMQA